MEGNSKDNLKKLIYCKIFKNKSCDAKQHCTFVLANDVHDLVNIVNRNQSYYSWTRIREIKDSQIRIYTAVGVP